MTVNKLIEKLLTLRDEGYGELPLIYSKDAEGNGYRKVYYEARPVQVLDLLVYDIEIFLDKNDDEGTDYNCVIIN